MRKYYVTVKNWHKIRRRPMEVLLATHDLTTRSGVIMSFFALMPTQFACAVLIDHQWSERLYTRQIITWGGSWYKIASARVPACACEGMSACVACVHIFASCMYRQYGSGRTSTFFWNQQHVTVINPRKEVATTPPHVPRGFMNCKRDTV